MKAILKCVIPILIFFQAVGKFSFINFMPPLRMCNILVIQWFARLYMEIIHKLKFVD